ncbi:MAG TPA: ABC-F family ATP-binding cassette domain-containing protein, partial [Burkholderiaceae bacterium]|nr:ABC-F family ATP-binding cassette domain-containing protein [Burkholderiaceae bacterium]
MIRAENITLRRGSKLLLDNASFVVHPGECIGVVGPNGAGKTSLFAVLSGQLEIDAGMLSMPTDWRIARVEQIIGEPLRPACEFVMDGDSHLRALQEKRRQTDENSDGTQIAELETALVEAGAYSAQARAEQLLSGLGFAKSAWMRPVGEFSGGWQMRVALARALMAPSDLLLLDEPTNHLDLDAMLWLERWMASYPGTILVISHDTAFLESTAQHILHFEDQQLNRYRGGYQAFIEQHAEKLRQHQQAHVRQQQETARLQQFIDRFRAKATKARQAQSRIKALARMQTLEPLRQQRGIDIQLPQPDAMPDPLLSLRGATIGYRQTNSAADIIVLPGIDLTVRGADRIGILGVNGAGKSSLIKTLAGELDLISGSRQPAKGLKIGYFAQQQL